MSYLKHHGVKGQQWGVRRGPPYPIEDTVLRKGTKLNSVSPYENSNEYLKNTHRKTIYTYNPDDEWDKKVYQGPFSYFKMRSTGLYIYDHAFETVKDLKMPTSKQRIDEFVSIYNKRWRITSRDLKQVQNWIKMLPADMLPPKLSDLTKVDLTKKIETDADMKRAYALFNHAMENASKFRSTRVYSKIMASKFDAMVDDNNVNVYNRAHDPIIVFRADKALRALSSTASAVDASTIINNMDYIEQELAKRGDHMAT